MSPRHKYVAGWNDADVLGTILETLANKKKVQRNANIKVTSTGAIKSTKDISLKKMSDVTGGALLGMCLACRSNPRKTIVNS